MFISHDSKYVNFKTRENGSFGMQNTIRMPEKTTTNCGRQRNWFAHHGYRQR